MDSEARLARALAADAAPARDPAFIIAVMQDAERERFRADLMGTVLRGAGVAAAVAALAIPLGSWAAANAEALQAGVAGSAGLIALVAAARIMTQRAAAAWAR
jgi:hypothetical protein